MNQEFVNYVNTAHVIVNTGSYLEFRETIRRKKRGRPIRFWFSGYMQTEEERKGKFIKIHMGEGRYTKISEKRIIFEEEATYWQNYCKGKIDYRTQWNLLEHTEYESWYINRRGQYFGIL